MRSSPIAALLKIFFISLKDGVVKLRSVCPIIHHFKKSFLNMDWDKENCRAMDVEDFVSQ
jgi:hypothetical protein